MQQRAESSKQFFIINAGKLDTVVKMTHKKKSDYYAANNVLVIMCVYMLFLSAVILFSYPNKPFIQATTSLN